MSSSTARYFSKSGKLLAKYTTAYSEMNNRVYC